MYGVRNIQVLLNIVVYKSRLNVFVWKLFWEIQTCTAVINDNFILKNMLNIVSLIHSVRVFKLCEFTIIVTVNGDSKSDYFLIF